MRMSALEPIAKSSHVEAIVLCNVPWNPKGDFYETRRNVSCLIMSVCHSDINYMLITVASITGTTNSSKCERMNKCITV